MTFTRWIQAIWFVSLLVVWAQVYIVARARKQLKRESERLQQLILLLEETIKRNSGDDDGTTRIQRPGPGDNQTL
jgi:hypothetical protein